MKGAVCYSSSITVVAFDNIDSTLQETALPNCVKLEEHCLAAARCDCGYKEVAAVTDERYVQADAVSAEPTITLIHAHGAAGVSA